MQIKRALYVGGLIALLGGFSGGYDSGVGRPLGLVSEAYAQDSWDVSNDSKRRAEILRRYKQLVESNPEEGLAFKKMVEYAGGAAGVAALVAEYEKKTQDHPDKVKYWLILGHLRKTATDYAEAILAYDEALKLDDKSAPGYLGRGQARMMLQQNTEATEDFEKALALEKGKDKKQDILRKLADLSFAQRDWEKAQEYYDRLIELEPRSEYLRMEYAQVLVKYKRYDKALEQYNALLKLSGRDVKARATAYRDMGELYELMGDYEKALETYKKAQSYVKSNNWLYREVEQRIIGVYRRMDKLIEYASEREKQWRSPNYDQAMMLANLFDELGQEDKAFDYYKIASRKSSRSVDPRFKMIQILQRRGDIAGVIKAYDALIRVAPSEPRYIFDLAKIHFRNGDQERALKLLKRVQSKFSRRSEVMVQLADMYMRFGKNDMALDVYERLVKKNPRNEMYILGLGEYYYQSGDTTKALKIWETLLKSNLPKAQAHAQFGLVLVDHGMVERGIEQYKLAADLLPDDPDVQRGLAVAYEMGRYWERAIDVWLKLMRGEPDSPMVSEARSRIVSLYKRQNKLRTKIREFKDAFEGTPPDVEAGYFLAEAYGKIGEHDRAEVVWNKIINLDNQIDKQDIVALQALEKMYTFRGETEKAIGVLQKLAEVMPAREREYYQRIAELSLKSYNDKQAVEYAQLALQKNPDDAMAHSKLGDVYAKMQQSEKAIASYRESLDLDPRNFDVYFKLAQLLVERDEFEEAYKLYLYVAKRATDEVQVLRASRRLVTLARTDDELFLLEQELAPEVFNSTSMGGAYRHVLMEIYARLSGVAVARRNAGATLSEADQARLKAVGTRAYPVLVDALQSQEVGQKQRAISMLAELDLKQAGMALARLAADDKESLRLNAMAAVAMLGSEDAAELLVPLLEDEDISVKESSTWALGALGSSKAIKPLQKLLERDDVGSRQKALAAISLGRVGDKKAVQPLLKTLDALKKEGIYDEQSMAVVMGLGLVGHRDGVNALGTILTEVADDDVVSTAAWSLGQVQDKSAVSALLDAYWSDDPGLRERAWRGLNWSVSMDATGGLRPDYRQMLKESSYIHEREKQVANRFDSMGLVRQLKQETTQSPVTSPYPLFENYSDTLLAMVKAKSKTSSKARQILWGDLMQDQLVLGVGMVSGDEQQAGVEEMRRKLIAAIKPELEAALKLSDLSWQERRAALVMLGMLGQQADLDLVVASYGSDKPIVRFDAMRAMGMFAGVSDARVKSLILKAVAEDDSPDVRAQAAVVLGQDAFAGQPDVVDTLIKGLEDTSLLVRVESARSLGLLRATSAVDALSNGLDTRDGEDLYARVYALARIGSTEAKKVLEPYLVHGDFRVREAIAQGEAR